MESPDPSPDDLREEAEQGGYEESEADAGQGDAPDSPPSEADPGQGHDAPDSPPDQDTSAQTGAEQGGGF